MGIKQSIMDVVNYFTQVAIKLSFLIIAYLAPVNVIFHAIWFFLVVDLITGIWKALKKGEAIRSYGLRRTIEKFLFYTLSVVVVWVVDKTFLGCHSHLASIIGGYIALTEVISIFENIAEITGHNIFLKIKDLIISSISDKLTKK